MKTPSARSAAIIRDSAITSPHGWKWGSVWYAEAARLILSWPTPLRLIRLEGDDVEEPTDDERCLFDLRNEWLSSLPEDGPPTRLMETLIYRHLADALYDGRLEERISFIRRAFASITDGWQDGRLDSLVERARTFSDTVEYDDEVLERWIAQGQDE